MPLGSKSDGSPGDERSPGSPPASGSAPGPARGSAPSSAPQSARGSERPSPGSAGTQRPRTMIPARSKRFAVESFVMRLIATAGIVGISVAVAAILGSSDVQPWIIGLVVSLLSVVLAAVLWSSRRL